MPADREVLKRPCLRAGRWWSGGDRGTGLRARRLPAGKDKIKAVEVAVKRRFIFRWLAVLALLMCALVPRLHLAGKIPAIQPQWALRAQWFWDALDKGNLQDTYIAPHPGLTVMWYAGAAQQLSSDQTRYGRVVAASRANAVIASFLILLAAWLVRRILVLDDIEGAGAIALFFGFVLALNPLLMVMTGLIGLDGPVSLMILVAFLTIVLHLRLGSWATLLAAGVTTGLAVATKVPGLLLLPAPLILCLGYLPTRKIPWRRVLITLGVLVAGAAVMTWALLPAAWADPIRIGQDLLVGKSLRDESLREVMTQGHLQFFMGRATRNPGVLFHPIQLLYRTTPLVLLGALLGLLTASFRRNRLVRETALMLIVVLLGLTLTGKKTWRYISPAVVLLDLIGALGFWFFVRYLASRWSKPMLSTVAWVALALQGLWVLNAAPYYALRMNPLVGGPLPASRVIAIGAGEGIEQALSFLEGHARRLDRTITWSGGYGSHPQKRKALEFESEWLEWNGRSPKGMRSDCHLFYIAELQRGALKEKGADRYWKKNGQQVLSVVEQGLELVQVKCREDLGIQPTLSEARGDPIAATPSSPLPRAIAFISLDTIRADHLSAYGYSLSTTPYLEKLAAEGVRVETAVSPMPTTDPSHLTMFTGLYPRTHGSLRNGVPLRNPALPNLAEALRNLGYETGAFVSRKHLIPTSLNLFGFDVEDGPYGPEREGGETVEKALRWARDRQGGQIFVWLHLFDPHFPYEPPEPFRSRFESPDADWPVAEKHRFPDPFPRAYMDTLIERYDAEIAYTDSLVERFVEGLQSMMSDGEAPLVIVVGDHGEALDELWERYDIAFDHGPVLSQGQLQVPLLFCWPGRLDEGVIDSSAAALVDIAPTLFDILQINGFQTQGQSLLPRIGSSTSNGLAFSQRRARMRRDNPGAKAWRSLGEENFSVQEGRYKLTLFMTGDSERTELYDLLRDPLELTDLSKTEPAIHERLLVALRDWLEDTPSIAEVQEIPEEKLEALRALGYLD